MKIEIKGAAKSETVLTFSLEKYGDSIYVRDNNNCYVVGFKVVNDKVSLMRSRFIGGSYNTDAESRIEEVDAIE